MNSVLNPEAPEFYPHLTSVTEDGYTKVTKTVKLANHLPAGVSYNIFKTYDDFSIVSYKVSSNVVIQSNEIVITELPAVKLKQNDLEYSTEKIIDVNDNMLDRVYINIDNLCKVNTPSEQFLANIKTNTQAWTSKPLITKIQVGTTLFIGAKNIPRPQLSFKDKIDNSDTLWVPKISDKPNNIKPLSLNILYNDEGEAVGYEHPYKLELDLYQPPAELLQPDAEPPPFPPTLEATKFTYIDTEDLVNELVEHLESVVELAIDVEHHSYRTYQGITCLIQISTCSGDYVIDTLAVREHIHKLNLCFTNPKKLKVFHGAEMDIQWLQRDFGVYVVGMFDTHQAARMLNIKGLSLKSLLMRYCSIDADKKYQLADWRIRPLPDELLEYARMDTHYLLYIWRCMREELLAAAQHQPHLLLSVFDQSRQICGLTYNKAVMSEDSHMSLYLRSKKTFNSRQMAALKLLYRWRDEQARSLDESTTYLLPNHMLMALAETLPREVQGVSACCDPMPPFLKQNLVTVHQMLLSCREMPLEPQLYQSTAKPISKLMQGPQLSYKVLDLVHFGKYEDDDKYDAERNSETTLYEEPDIPLFEMLSDGKSLMYLEDLLTPYNRYKQYRTLAQIEEMKEFKDKEAKIAALAKGNDLIKNEVLTKLQGAQTPCENDAKEDQGATAVIISDEEGDADAVADVTDTEAGTSGVRKRRMSKDKSTKKNKNKPCSEQVIKTEKNKNKNQSKVKNKSEQVVAGNVKPFNYKNVNYRKFRDDSEKSHKQTKMKYKKPK